MNTRLPILPILLLAVAACRRETPAPAVADASRPRIVSLAPSLTELVAAVGGVTCLVGRTTACDYPPEAVRLVPPVGGFGVPAMESLVAANPTLVIDVDLEDEALIGRFGELGIRYRRVPCDRIADIPAAIRTVGELTGGAARAEAMASELERAIENFRQRAAAAASRPRVYIEIWHDPIMTAGGRAYLTDLIALAGGTSIAADIDRDYFQASPEWVVQRDPEVIVCAYMSLEGSMTEALRRRPGWSSVTAVRRGLVFDGLDNNVILRPGPRVRAGIEILQACIAKARER